MRVATCQVVSSSSDGFSNGQRHALPGATSARGYRRGSWGMFESLVCREGICMTIFETSGQPVAVAVFASVVCHILFVTAARGSGCQVVLGAARHRRSFPWWYGVHISVCHGLGSEARIVVGSRSTRRRGSTRRGSHRQVKLQHGWLTRWACPRKA